MKKYAHNIFWIRLINSKIFVILIVVLIVLISHSIYREINDQKGIRNNIKNLEKEKLNLDEENTNLVQLLRYYKSDEYVELQAREKLNMARQGEHIVIVPNNNMFKQNNANQKKMSNWELWVKYFFDN